MILTLILIDFLLEIKPLRLAPPQIVNYSQRVRNCVGKRFLAYRLGKRKFLTQRQQTQHPRN